MTVYSKLQNAGLNGYNVKRDGSRREWNDCVCTGAIRESYHGEHMIQVLDPARDDEERWVNTATFTGVVSLIYDGAIYFTNGSSVHRTDEEIDKICEEKYQARCAMIHKEFGIDVNAC